MGTTAARHAYWIVQNVRNVLAIELICALQAVEIKGIEKLSPVTRRFFDAGRAAVPSITKDRVFSDNIASVNEWLKKGEW